MKKNVAVIGCGHWGKNLVRNFSEIGALVAVCDPNIELAKSFAQNFKVKNLTFDEILSDKDIKGVVLAVPASLHASMAIKAMNAGKHTYVEKPLAMNEEEARNMIEVSKDQNVQLMVGHLLQYHPIFVSLRKLVKKNYIGDLNYIYSNRLSFGKVRSEEDVIWSFSPHDISMILSLIGEEPDSVRAEYSNILQSNIADIATLHMIFKSKIKAHIFISWLHPYKEHKLVVIGSTGMMVFDDTKPWNQKLSLYRHSIDMIGKEANLNKAEVEYINVPESEPLRNECEHFSSVVNGELLPLTDADEGLRVLNVLTAASTSQKQNN